MLVKIRNKYSQEAVISVEKFDMSIGTYNELQLHFTHLPDNVLKQLMTLIGMRESYYSKAVWVIDSNDLSHLSSQ